VTCAAGCATAGSSADAREEVAGWRRSWTTANEVTDATNWVSGGRALASKTYTVTWDSTGVFKFTN
jgi:hypothetical protein